ncbi:MAG: hypothetical protein V1704_04630 [Candidatus Vogelbacteria bacterium]
MQLRKLLVLFFVLSFSLYALHFVSASWYGPGNNDPPWGGISPPVNTSDVPQTKNGNLFINGDLTVRNFSVANGPNEKVIIGFTTSDPRAILDINGQVRIRGDCFTAGGCSGKVLMASTTDNGLAVWGNLSSISNDLQNLNPDYFTPHPLGIILTDTDSPTGAICGVTTTHCRIDVATTTIQTKITGTCPSSSAISEVKQDGTVSCQPLVSSISTSETVAGDSGLSGGGDGPITLSINPGAGLEVSGNNFQVKTPPVGSGLVISNNYLQFATTTPALNTACSGSNVYWKYNASNGKWDCGAPQGVSGASIMYLKSNSSTPTCPTGWTSLGATTEYVSSLQNYGIICKRSVDTDRCQVMYLTNTAVPPSVPPLISCTPGNYNPPACPGDWFDATVAPSIVYASGGSSMYCNKVRTCYKCN